MSDICPTEETVGHISDIDTKEIVEETPDVKIKEIPPEITAEETVGDKQDTEVCRPYVPLSVQDKEEITTEEIVEVIQNDNLLETPEIEIQETSEKRLEELKAVMIDWMEFNFTEHKSEEEYLEAREKMIKIEEEKQITQIEWDKIWKMFARKKRKERKRQRQKQGKIANKIAIYKNRRISKARKIDYTWEKNPTEKRRGQVKAKGQENPLTRRKEEMLDEKVKSVVVFEPDKPPGNVIN